MKKVSKLTPGVLKKIIAEEKRKLALKRKSRKRKISLQEQINSISKLRKMQKRKLKEVNAIKELKRRIKRSIIKRL